MVYENKAQWHGLMLVASHNNQGLNWQHINFLCIYEEEITINFTVGLKAIGHSQYPF